MSPLDAEALNLACEAAALPWTVRTVDRIPSTSDALRDAAMAGEAPGLVLFAEGQTAGRGRRDNRWVTPHGQDLMVSMLLRPNCPSSLWPRLTSLAALALCRMIEEELPLQPRIKWPNDIYLHDRKVAGLLAEAVTTPSGMMLVLGIGLNVNTTEFPPELSHSATSLLAALQRPETPALQRQPLALALLRHLHLQFQQIEDDFHDAIREIRQRSWLMGRQIRATVQGEEIYGRAVDLNAEGHLILALADGSLTTVSSADGVRQVV